MILVSPSKHTDDQLLSIANSTVRQAAHASIKAGSLEEEHAIFYPKMLPLASLGNTSCTSPKVGYRHIAASMLTFMTPCFGEIQYIYGLKKREEFDGSLD